ncbi:unnamed protein product [Pedinophyceae sp. YPF-701]|nr:unnamed protein product [Pedinophyceae sp. YPF-701]
MLCETLGGDEGGIAEDAGFGDDGMQLCNKGSPHAGEALAGASDDASNVDSVGTVDDLEPLEEFDSDCDPGEGLNVEWTSDITEVISRAAAGRSAPTEDVPLIDRVAKAALDALKGGTGSYNRLAKMLDSAEAWQIYKTEFGTADRVKAWWLTHEATMPVQRVVQHGPTSSTVLYRSTHDPAVFAEKLVKGMKGMTTAEIDDLFKPGKPGRTKFYPPQRCRAYRELTERVRRTTGDDEVLVLAIKFSSDDTPNGGSSSIHPLYATIANAPKDVQRSCALLAAELPKIRTPRSPAAARTAAREAWQRCMRAILEPFLQETLRPDESGRVGVNVRFPDGVSRRIALVPAVWCLDILEKIAQACLRLHADSAYPCSKCMVRSVSMPPVAEKRRWEGMMQKIVGEARDMPPQKASVADEHCQKSGSTYPVVPASTLFAEYIDMYQMFYPDVLHVFYLGWPKKLVVWTVMLLKEEGSGASIESIDSDLHALQAIVPGMGLPGRGFTIDKERSTSAQDVGTITRATGQQLRTVAMVMPFLLERHANESCRRDLVGVWSRFLRVLALIHEEQPTPTTVENYKVEYGGFLDAVRAVFGDLHNRARRKRAEESALRKRSRKREKRKAQGIESDDDADMVEDAPFTPKDICHFPKSHEGWHMAELIEDWGGGTMASTGMFEAKHRSVHGFNNHNAASERRQPSLALVPTALWLHAAARWGVDVAEAARAMVKVEFVKGIKLEGTCGIAPAHVFETTPAANMSDVPTGPVQQADVWVPVEGGKDRIGRLVAVARVKDLADVAVIQMFSKTNADDGQRVDQRRSSGLGAKRVVWAARNEAIRGKTVTCPELCVVPVSSITRRVLLHAVEDRQAGERGVVDDRHLWNAARIGGNFTRTVFAVNDYVHILT